MAEWKQVKIGDIAKHRKGSIVIKDDTEYKLCRVQLHKRGIVLREKLLGAAIKTKKQQVCKTGDIVVAEMDAKFGGYGFINEDLDGAIVSSHYYIFELNPKLIYRDYFMVLIHSGMIQNQIEAKGSTNYSSIRAWEFLDYKIPLPDLKCQKDIAKRFLDCYNGRKELQMQGDQQLSLLKQLRQQILQEAIEGKLTSEWRKKHPELISGENHAAKLLEKIKTEKERLIEKGNIRESREISNGSTIRDIQIPEKWVWAKGDDILFVTKLAGFEYTKYIHLKESGDVPVIRAQNVRPLNIATDSLLYIDFKISKNLERSALTKECLLVTFIGAGIGDVATFHENIRWHLAPNVAKMEPYGNKSYLSLKFLNYYLMAKTGQSEIFKHVKATAQPCLSMGTIRDIDYPIPPIAEQKAIVERVDKLMAMVDEMEKQVIERKSQSEMLMQSVLRDSLSSQTYTDKYNYM